MRLHELRLVEDHRSCVKFPGNLTVVAGCSPDARAWLVRAVPALLRGEECGSSAYVQLDGSTREIGAGGPGPNLLTKPARIVLDAAPFDAVIAAGAPTGHPSAGGSAEPAGPAVSVEQLERARAAYDDALRSLDALERSTELTRAEHSGALVTAEDLRDRIVEARASVDPMAAVVRDRALETAARLEVETGAAPGVCRGESEQALDARIGRLEAALFEYDSALQALVPVDTAAIDQALDIVRIITADGPIELPEAIRLADEYRALRLQIAGLEERIAVEEGGMAAINDRLDQARARFAAAEARVQPVQTDAEDIAALERAHDAVLEAEKKVSGLFGNRARKLLDDAVAEERVILDRLGYPTWSAFIMGARMLDSAAENKRELELARRELDEVERVYARVMGRLQEEPEFLAYLDRLERLQEAAHAIVGDVDDVEVALRSLRVDPGPPPMTVDAARENLAACLLDVGFGIEDHATLDDLVPAARGWLDDVREIVWLHGQLEADARHCAFELDAARDALERIQAVGAADEIDGFGADRLRAARENIARAEERVWAHRDAVIRMAQLVAEAERVMDLEAKLAASLEESQELLGITHQLVQASAEKLALLVAAHDPDAAAPAATVLAPSEPRADRVEELAAILEERITELRDAGIDGSVPLVLDEPLAGCTPTERAELLGWIEGYSLFLQIIYVAGGPEAVAWAEARHSNRTRVVRGEGYFA